MMKVIVLIVILLIAVVPFTLIWSLNTLFAVGIVCSLKTWFAALIFAGMFGASLSNR